MSSEQAVSADAHVDFAMLVDPALTSDLVLAVRPTEIMYHPTDASSVEFIELMKFEVDRARQFLVSGASVIDQLPLMIQIDIELFAAGGLCILDRIQKIGYRVLEQRPVVTKLDGLRLLASATVRVISRALLKPFRRKRS